MGKPITKRWEFWAAIGLTVLCSGLVFGGVFLGWATPNAGHMTYCHSTMEKQILYLYTYTGDGPKDIDTRDECKDNKPVSLNKLPATVSTMGLEDREEESLKRAIKGFNDRAGCTVFKFDQSVVNAIVVVWRKAREVGSIGHVGAETHHYQVNDGTVHAHIDVYNVPMDAELDRALMHELGHAAGLAHDAFQDSLMFRDSSGSSYMTDGDEALLKERYCK